MKYVVYKVWQNARSVTWKFSVPISDPVKGREFLPPRLDWCKLTVNVRNRNLQSAFKNQNRQSLASCDVIRSRVHFYPWQGQHAPKITNWVRVRVHVCRCTRAVRSWVVSDSKETIKAKKRAMDGSSNRQTDKRSYIWNLQLKREATLSYIRSRPARKF